MPRKPPATVRSRRRAIVFRLAAVALGLSPLLLLEGLLWCFGAGAPCYDHDPFVGFRCVHPLFVLSDDARHYQIAPSRLAYFCPDSFAAKKAPNEFRIFCLGGSTIQGSPFGIETSFTTFLELGLQAAEPETLWQVVNCGGVSYASYRLVPILEEVLRYQPDLIIVCTGHNEFLEDRTYRHIKQMPELVARPAELLARTRTCQLLHRWWQSDPTRNTDEACDGRPVLPGEVDAMLEYRGGLDRYHRDDKWRRDIELHFRFNLNRMVAMARKAGVPLLLVNPVCNLRDCPPFKSQHRSGLATDDLQRWQSLVSQAAAHCTTNAAETVRLLEEALLIDDQHAGLHYLLAKTYDSMGDLQLAARQYIAAKEDDVCPLRILESMHRAILDTAAATGTPLVDVRRMYQEICQGGIPGDMYLVDHVHPSVEGHQLMADLIAAKLSLMGLVHPGPAWPEQRREAYRAQLDSLDNLYFAHGQQRLDILRGWTQGRAGTDWVYQHGKPVFIGQPKKSPRTDPAPHPGGQ